jgi:hypothetical protein
MGDSRASLLCVPIQRESTYNEGLASILYALSYNHAAMKGYNFIIILYTLSQFCNGI